MNRIVCLILALVVCLSLSLTGCGKAVIYDQSAYTPGTTEGNWQWRMLEGEASDKLAKRIFALSVLYGRTEQSVEEKKSETKKAE